jgi:hypothetical protein
MREFQIWGNFSYEGISVMREFQLWGNFRYEGISDMREFQFEGISDMMEFQIWGNFRYEGISDMKEFQIWGNFRYYLHCIVTQSRIRCTCLLGAVCFGATKSSSRCWTLVYFVNKKRTSACSCCVNRVRKIVLLFTLRYEPTVLGKEHEDQSIFFLFLTRLLNNQHA